MFIKLKKSKIIMSETDTITESQIGLYKDSSDNLYFYHGEKTEDGKPRIHSFPEGTAIYLDFGKSLEKLDIIEFDEQLAKKADERANLRELLEGGSFDTSEPEYKLALRKSLEEFNTFDSMHIWIQKQLYNSKIELQNHYLNKEN